MVAGGDGMLRRMNTWWRRSMVCINADQFAEILLESSGAGAQGTKLFFMWKWTLEYLDRLWLHVQMKVCRQQRHRARFPQYLRLHLRQKIKGVHAKALKIRAFWSEIGRTPGCPACETSFPGKSHTRECKSYQDAWGESRRNASAE